MCDGGFQLIHFALECLLFGGRKGVVGTAVTAAIVVASAVHREDGFQLTNEIFCLSVLGGGRGGDLSQITTPAST